jgi:hypothetical protein
MTSIPERRRHPRFIAWLPIRLTAVAGKVEPEGMPLLTQNISKAGVRFLAPRRIEPGQFIEVEVTLGGSGPDGQDVHITSVGQIVRIEPASKPGWCKLAADFGQQPAGDGPGWDKLVAKFQQSPPSETDS